MPIDISKYLQPVPARPVDPAPAPADRPAPTDRPARRRRAGRAPEPPSDGLDGRPTIRVVAGEIDRVVDDAERALIEADVGVYQRGGMLVSPGRAAVRTAAGEVVAPRLFPLRLHHVAELLTRAATFEKFDARVNDWVRVDAPAKVAATLLEREGKWRAPVLTGLIFAPTLRADGTILDRPGFDAATGLLLVADGTAFPPIPPAPTLHAARTAVDLLSTELLDGFDFVGDADRAVALSGILTALVRRSLPTAPLHAFTAPTAGSGKSMLVDVAATIATGRPAPVMAMGATPEELEKRIAGVLIGGDPVMTIDNVEAPLGGDVLNQMLTQQLVRLRPLGTSAMVDLPAAVFVAATGNNLQVAGDMTRRTLVCRLDPGVERPELRSFDVNPLARVATDRGRYVAAAITILRAYVVAGRPVQALPIGSFEAWSRMVRDALTWAGCADPVETIEHARGTDPRLAALAAVIETWARDVGIGNRVGTAELVNRAGERFADGELVHPDLRAALMAVAGEGSAINATRLGRWIAKNVERVVAGHRIEKGPTVGGTARFSLVPAGRRP
jgi:putative DNA primase/helicase